MENMESNILLKRFLFIICLLSFFSLHAEPDVLRFSIWALLDDYPANIQLSENDTVFTRPLVKLKQIAPFVLEGMIYGWSFSYTPSDKARGVEEYFEITPYHKIDVKDPSLSFKEPYIADGKLTCWVEFERTREMMEWKEHKSSFVYRKIKGYGFGPISNEFDGIEKAYTEAAKNAIREYCRKIYKNKPKEINGFLFFADFPLLGIDSGKYRATLELYLSVDEVIQYSAF